MKLESKFQDISSPEFGFSECRILLFQCGAHMVCLLPTFYLGEIRGHQISTTQWETCFILHLTCLRDGYSNWFGCMHKFILYHLVCSRKNTMTLKTNKRKNDFLMMSHSNDVEIIVFCPGQVKRTFLCCSLIKVTSHSGASPNDPTVWSEFVRDNRGMGKKGQK